MGSKRVQRKHSYQDFPPSEYSTVVGLDGTTNLVKVGVSCSDSALNQEPDLSPKKPPRMPKTYSRSVEEYQILPKNHQPYSIKSAELRRKSEASNDIYRDTLKQGDILRRKSDITVRNNYFGQSDYRRNRKYISEDPAVMTHQRRSVVHVSGGSKRKAYNYNTLPGGNRRAITSQPVSGSLPGPSENPDWPVLSENECENNGDNSVIHKTDNGNYGILSVTEGVKGLVKLLHIPFQCCKRKVCT